MRRLLACAVALVAGLAAFPSSALNIDTGFFPACQGGASFTCQDLFIDSFDGTGLDATIYIPNAASPSNRASAVLMTHGYGGWHRGAGDFALQQQLASNGYVVLAYTSRGFGRSEGEVQLDSPDFEVQDARHLITWLGTPANTGNVVRLDGPASRQDPRVGMAGVSYAGGIQLLTAAYDDRVDAITPQITWNDLRYSLAPNGVVKQGWIDLLYAAGVYGGYLGPIGTVPPPVVSTEGAPLDQHRSVVSTYLTNDDIDQPVPLSDGSQNTFEYLERRSPIFNGVIDNIDAATLLIQGQRDTLFNLNEAIANYEAISDNSVNIATKLVVFSAGHGYADLAGERAAINDRILTWFDRYLNGNDAADTGSGIEVWRPWVAGSNFADLSSFPDAATDAGIPAGGPTFLVANLVAPTSHTETSNFQQQTNSPARDLTGLTAINFLGSIVPGPDPVTVAGIPELRFRIGSQTTEAIVFAKLWDEDTNVSPPVRTPIHRLVTPVRIRGGKGDFCSGDALPGPATVGIVSGVDVCLPLAGTVWQLAPGHRIVLTIATSDTMFFSSRQPSIYSVGSVSLKLPTTTGL